MSFIGCYRFDTNEVECFGELFETDEIERLLVKSLIVDAFERNFVRDIHLQGVTVLMKNDLEFYVNEDNGISCNSRFRANLSH